MKCIVVCKAPMPHGSKIGIQFMQATNQVINYEVSGCKLSQIVTHFHARNITRQQNFKCVPFFPQQYQHRQDQGSIHGTP